MDSQFMNYQKYFCIEHIKNIQQAPSRESNLKSRQMDTVSITTNLGQMI